jgi:tRNA(Arg) A34 adenosine deaminase TadA
MKLDSRRSFLHTATLAVAAPLLGEAAHALPSPRLTGAPPSAFDIKTMRSLADFTALSFDTDHPTVFGADIVDTKSGKSLMREINHVFPLHDPSAHGEIYTIRLACAKLQSPALHGYTLYTTCEPCPMCMACILWCGLDRVVYGATIDDAARFGSQIMLYAKDLAQRWAHPCIVDGPVEQERCVALFTDPRMQAVFSKWKAR